jgi:hypothetical protein
MLDIDYLKICHKNSIKNIFKTNKFPAYTSFPIVFNTKISLGQFPIYKSGYKSCHILPAILVV